jgi:hypothetical protein
MNDKMTKRISYIATDELEKEDGCAYIVEASGSGRQTCGATRRLSSPYCPSHHSLCYLVGGSKAETDRLREVEALASAVGGRRARQRAQPTRQFLKRLEQVVRELF